MVDWTDAPPLAALRAFEAAARHGTLSAAARELNVTHAAIAQSVRKLEAHIGAALLQRVGRGVQVTETGGDLAWALNQGFTTITDALGRMRADADTRPLAVSVTPAFATNWLMPRIGDFWSNHPEIALSIQPGVDLVDMLRDGVDLAVRYGAGDWPGVEAERLTDGDYWVVAHPRLLMDRKASCVSDVADLPWLLESYMVERRSLIEAEGVRLEDLTTKLLENNWMVLSAAQAGLGIAVQPRILVDNQVASGALSRICALEGESSGYYIVTRPGHMPPRLRVLRRWLRAQAEA